MNEFKNKLWSRFEYILLILLLVVWFILTNAGVAAAQAISQTLQSAVTQNTVLTSQGLPAYLPTSYSWYQGGDIIQESMGAFAGINKYQQFIKQQLLTALVLVFCVVIQRRYGMR